MPFYLILTGNDCVEVDLSKSYYKDLFNWGICSGRDVRASCGPVDSGIEIDHVSGQQFSHTGGQWPVFCFTQQVEVVWKKGPGINVHGTINCQFS